MELQCKIIQSFMSYNARREEQADINFSDNTVVLKNKEGFPKTSSMEEMFGGCKYELQITLEQETYTFNLFFTHNKQIFEIQPEEQKSFKNFLKIIQLKEKLEEQLNSKNNNNKKIKI